PITDEDDRVHPIVREAYGVLVDLAANDLEAPPPRPPLAIEAAAGAEERRIEASVEALRGVVRSERHEVAVAREYLSRVTAAGFDAFPAADEPRALDDGTILAADPAFPVRSVALHGVRIVAGCGHSRVLPDVPAVTELLDALNEGGALRAADLLDRFGDRW